MQGLLFHYLQDFVGRELGPGAWSRVRERAGIPHSTFLMTRVYPDEHLPALVEAIRLESGTPAPDPAEVLFRFGLHVGACFERDFGAYFRRFASAREMLAGIEPVIHTELRRRSPESRPPRLRTAPLPGGRLRIVYDSPRRLCPVVRALAVTVARHFGERIEIEEPACMHRGDAACELVLAFPGR